MKTGWNFFFSLLIADGAFFVACKLGLEGWVPWLVSGMAFVLFVILFTLNSLMHRYHKARLAKVQKQNEVSEAPCEETMSETAPKTDTIEQ